MHSEPVIAQSQAKAVVQKIDNTLAPKPQATWETQVLPKIVAAQAPNKASRDATEAAILERSKALQAAQAAEQARTQLVSLTQATQALNSSCSDAKSCIYSHESGNNPARWNSSGCVGLGQACPASKLQAVCPNLDYGCEDAWFTDYMLKRYGSWGAAWAFWQRTDCRPYCDHWW